MARLTPPLENWTTFRARLTAFSPQDQATMEWAYQLAKAAHRDQWRQAGERYFEHPRAVVLILLDECTVNTVDALVVALLHDVPEDTAMFGHHQHYTYEEWLPVVHDRIARIFNDAVAASVLAVTKPYIDAVTIHTDNEAETRYLANLRQGSPEARLVKMADRLHNLRTLGATPPEKQRRKISETREHYYPIFAQNHTAYPRETRYLLQQMERAIAQLETAHAGQ